MHAYSGLMQRGTSLSLSRREPVPQELLPRWLRVPTATLLAACAVVTVALAVQSVGHGQPGRLDSALDPRIEAGLSRFPVLLSWLPDLGTLRPVALITLALVVACVATRRWSGAVLAAVAVPAAVGLTESRSSPLSGRLSSSPSPAAMPPACSRWQRSARSCSLIRLGAMCPEPSLAANTRGFHAGRCCLRSDGGHRRASFHRRRSRCRSRNGASSGLHAHPRPGDYPEDSVIPSRGRYRWSVLRGPVIPRDNYLSPASWRIRSSSPFQMGASSGAVPPAFWIASRTIWLSAEA